MIRIITGSSADFEPHELETMNITCIPLSVLFGEDEYKENVNITKDDFYKMLTERTDSPKTSQPTTADFLELFEECKNAGDDVVGVFVSSKLSGTFQGAVLAKSMCNYENCYLVDSLSATVGENLLVREAVKLRDMGFSAKEIYEKLEQLKEKIKIYACLDTLEYLRRGGRISGASAAVGTVAHIKPIIHVCNNGVVETYAKAIGRRKGISTIV
ncbi:MAG: DegV family protein, partial [Clostridia bacterium]|nr:DegV family protein [Clostridia bacterium]